MRQAKATSMTSTPHPGASSPLSAASRPWLLVSALALLVALAVVAAPPARAAKLATKAPAAKLTLTKVTVEGAKLTITGRVSLPPVTARTARLRESKTISQRKHAEVHLTLISIAGKTEKTEEFTAKLTSRDSFTATHTTRLSGALGLDAIVKISGKRVVKTISVAASTGARTLGTTTSGGTTPGSPGSPGSSSSASGGGTPLVGTFELQAGAQAVSGALSGSYFQMLEQPTYTVALSNPSSTALNQTYTLLSPGTDGGLSTAHFQPPPEPAWSNPGSEQGVGSLSNAIIQPLPFFSINFGIATQASDLQDIDLGVNPPETDPLPSVVDTDGVLSGQVTAWTAGWNEQWFNQGSPKPNGALPTGSTPLTGAYDAADGQYTLEWHSLIVGGQFNGFVGSWHLAGTFVAAS
jgi:23S rRNA pseudoU1915 N3-methylase RlmH